MEAFVIAQGQIARDVERFVSNHDCTNKCESCNFSGSEPSKVRKYKWTIKTVNETAEKFMGHFIDKVSCLVDAELKRCLPLAYANMSALERPAPSCNLGPNENKTVFSYRPAQL
jgi:hypothetical protein